MARKQLRFWLQTDIEEEKTMYDASIDLKDKRQFAQFMRDCLRLMLDLKQGNLDVLHEIFPWTDKSA